MACCGNKRAPASTPRPQRNAPMPLHLAQPQSAPVSRSKPSSRSNRSQTRSTDGELGYRRVGHPRAQPRQRCSSSWMARIPSRRSGNLGRHYGLDRRYSDRGRSGRSVVEHRAEPAQGVIVSVKLLPASASSPPTGRWGCPRSRRSRAAMCIALGVRRPLAARASSTSTVREAPIGPLARSSSRAGPSADPGTRRS